MKWENEEAKLTFLKYSSVLICPQKSFFCFLKRFLIVHFCKMLSVLDNCACFLNSLCSLIVAGVFLWQSKSDVTPIKTHWGSLWPLNKSWSTHDDLHVQQDLAPGLSQPNHPLLYTSFTQGLVPSGIFHRLPIGVFVYLHPWSILIWASAVLTPLLSFQLCSRTSFTTRHNHFPQPFSLFLFLLAIALIIFSHSIELTRFYVYWVFSIITSY